MPGPRVTHRFLFDGRPARLLTDPYESPRTRWWQLFVEGDEPVDFDDYTELFAWFGHKILGEKFTPEGEAIIGCVSDGSTALKVIEIEDSTSAEDPKIKVKMIYTNPDEFTKPFWLPLSEALGC